MATAGSISFSKNDRGMFLAVGAAAFLAVFGAFNPHTLIAALSAAAFILFVAVRGYRYGVLLIAALTPFLGLRFQLPPFQEGFFSRVFPDGIDLALVNIVGLVLAGTFAADMFVRWFFAGRRTLFRLPGFWYAAAFLAASFLSVQNADDRLLSVKYVLYPIAFSILIFAYLSVNLIRTRRLYMTTLRVVYATGIIASLVGLLSIVLAHGGGLLRRATVLGFGGIYPLGMNHNLLAETLIAAAPFGFALAAVAREVRAAYWYRVGSLVMAGVAILTFARTAWIAVALQIGLWLWFEYRHRLRSLMRPAALVLLLASPLILYMLVFSRTPAVTGSTAARLAMTNFSIFLFFQHPVVGAGAGTFVERLGGTLDFTQDFGDPLDAHGFVQKILAEQGTLGIASFIAFIIWILRALYLSWRAVPASARGEKRIMLMAFLSVVGVVVYQIFNTSYYNAKLWLPIGLALAARELTKRGRLGNQDRV